MPLFQGTGNLSFLQTDDKEVFTASSIVIFPCLWIPGFPNSSAALSGIPSEEEPRISDE